MIWKCNLTFLGCLPGGRRGQTEECQWWSSPADFLLSCPDVFRTFPFHNWCVCLAGVCGGRAHVDSLSYALLQQPANFKHIDVLSVSAVWDTSVMIWKCNLTFLGCLRQCLVVVAGRGVPMVVVACRLSAVLS